MLVWYCAYCRFGVLLLGFGVGYGCVIGFGWLAGVVGVCD